MFTRPRFPSGVQTAEQVSDIVCANDLQPDPQTHRCTDNGARVDLSDCSYSADLGAAELSKTWTDYLRVLENPICRWTKCRALARGTAPPPVDPPTAKERASSSPIWYTPAEPQEPWRRVTAP